MSSEIKYYRSEHVKIDKTSSNFLLIIFVDNGVNNIPGTNEYRI